MKHEWKKQEKEIYGVKTKPCVIDIPAWKYIILYRRMGKEHREIYLNNANRTEKANLKTILRYKVTDMGK